MSHEIVATLVLLSGGYLFLGQGCGSSKGHSNKADSNSDGALADQTDLSSSESLIRLTPEQLAKYVEKSLGVTLPAKTRTGSDSDLFRTTFNIPLGGVDYSAVRVRDPLDKAQTLLVARHLAWQIASKLVGDEANRIKAGQPPTFFTQCNLKSDRPFLPNELALMDISLKQDASSANRWNDQIQTFYMRVFTRSATAAEIEAIRITFITVFQNEKRDFQKAWISVIYAVLSTEEFWHI